MIPSSFFSCFILIGRKVSFLLEHIGQSRSSDFASLLPLQYRLVCLESRDIDGDKLHIGIQE